MFPFLIPVPMAESDVTARAAIEQSFASSATQGGQGSSLTGAEAGFKADTRTDMAAYGIELSGLYVRLATLRISEDEDPPPGNNFSGNLGTTGSWQTSPLTRANASASGFIASRLGVRADDALAARDPFLGDRTEYTVDGGLGFSAIASRRSSWNFNVGYRQSGAVTADNPEAVGIDVHQGRASIASPYEVGAQDTLTPELRYSINYFNNALLDIYLTRGAAEVHTGTALLSETHHFTRRLYSTVLGGVTVGNPNPILESEDPIIAPEAGLQLTYSAQRSRATAGYLYGYTSLGPRIGFGQTHTASLELETHPIEGARYRDFVLRGVGRFSYGAAPVGANPPLITGEDPGPTALEGTLTTTTAVAGLQIEYPLVRGIHLLGGFDLEYLTASFDPVPPTGEPESSIRTIVTIGIVAVISSDPRQTVRPDPNESGSEAPPSRRDDPATERLDDLTGTQDYPLGASTRDPRTGGEGGRPAPRTEAPPSTN